VGGMLRGVALTAIVAVLAGCGGDDEEVGESVPVERFNERAAASRAPWTRSVDRFAAEFLRLDRRDDEALQVSFEERTGGRDPEITVTLDRLSDDSVRAERYVLSLERQTDGTLRLVSARRSWRCWEGRGHQDFSTELCL
jgi:hypothetical protein